MQLKNQNDICQSGSITLISNFVSLKQIECILFPPIHLDATKETIQSIVASEKQFVSKEEGVLRLYELVGGDLRKTINTVQAIALCSGQLDCESVNLILLNSKYIQIEDFVSFLRQNQIGPCVTYLDKHLAETSQDFIEWIRFVFDYLFAAKQANNEKEEKELVQ